MGSDLEASANVNTYMKMDKWFQLSSTKFQTQSREKAKNACQLNFSFLPSIQKPEALMQQLREEGLQTSKDRAKLTFEISQQFGG